MKKFIIALIVVSMFAAGAAIAQPQGRDYQQGVQGEQGEQRGRGGHRGPPAEAIDACASLTEGDVCSFVVPQRDLEGTCRSMRQSEEVACVPADHQRRAGRQQQQQ